MWEMTKMNKDKFIARLKKLSYPKLAKRAWKVWSLKRRKESADYRGYVTCITCDAVHPYQEMELGHFCHGKLSFNKQATQIQCTRCNHYLSGNLGKYADWLNKTYGQGTSERLHKLAGKEKDRPYSKDELISIILGE